MELRKALCRDDLHWVCIYGLSKRWAWNREKHGTRGVQRMDCVMVVVIRCHVNNHLSMWRYCIVAYPDMARRYA